TFQDALSNMDLMDCCVVMGLKGLTGEARRARIRQLNLDSNTNLSVVLDVPDSESDDDSPYMKALMERLEGLNLDSLAKRGSMIPPWDHVSPTVRHSLVMSRLSPRPVAQATTPVPNAQKREGVMSSGDSMSVDRYPSPAMDSPSPSSPYDTQSRASRTLSPRSSVVSLALSIASAAIERARARGFVSPLVASSVETPTGLISPFPADYSPLSVSVPPYPMVASYHTPSGSGFRLSPSYSDSQSRESNEGEGERPSRDSTSSPNERETETETGRLDVETLSPGLPSPFVLSPMMGYSPIAASVSQTVEAVTGGERESPTLHSFATDRDVHTPMPLSRQGGRRETQGQRRETQVYYRVPIQDGVPTPAPRYRTGDETLQRVGEWHLSARASVLNQVGPSLSKVPAFLEGLYPLRELGSIEHAGLRRGFLTEWEEQLMALCNQCTETIPRCESTGDPIHAGYAVALTAARTDLEALLSRVVEARYKAPEGTASVARPNTARMRHLGMSPRGRYTPKGAGGISSIGRRLSSMSTRHVPQTAQIGTRSHLTYAQTPTQRRVTYTPRPITSEYGQRRDTMSSVTWQTRRAQHTSSWV
ncbi:hypothetical protein KIPB_003072, partial [Kipferlia bialata]